MTQNYGVRSRTSRGTVNYGLAGRLDAREHVGRLADCIHNGLLDMERYNRLLRKTVHYREPGRS